MKSATISSGGYSTYSYLADGRRFFGNDSGSVMQYIWDEQNVLADAITGTIRGRYTATPGTWDDLFGEFDSSGSLDHFYGFDMMGNTNQLTDTTNTPSNAYLYQYTAFGESYDVPGPSIVAFMFGGRNGYYTDNNISNFNQIYVRARYYDPIKPRWLTRDPIWPADGWNPYEFVGNNPVNWVDPSGQIKDTGLRCAPPGQKPSGGWHCAASPIEIGVGPEGVRVVRRKGAETYPWSRVGWARPSTNSFSHRRELVIYDLGGNKLVTVVDTVQHFDYLIQLVNYYIGLQNNPASERVRSKKARGTGLFMIAASVILLGVAGGNAYFAHHDQQAAALLQTQGVAGTAQIERHFLAPNGVTPRLQYRITTPGGRSADNNVQMDPASWDALAGATAVKVVYVPSDPSISRLAAGEVSDDDLDPAAKYLLSGAIGAMCLVFLAAGFLNCAGRDVTLDKTTGKVSIRRFGDPS